MRTPQIIPFKELAKAALFFDAVGRWAQVDPFVLHGPPQALDEDVVVAAPAAVHADLDFMIPQHLGELITGELRPLIGIEDAGLAEPGEGLAQRLDTEPRRQRIRHPPGQHPPGRPVDDRDQVQKSLPHWYVGYVSSPHLVRPVDCLAAQEVWVDLMPGMPLAGIPLRSDRPQPELSHQPPDAPAAHRNPLSQQRHLEPAAAAHWTVCENPVEPLQKLEFLRRFRPRPAIEASWRKPQKRAGLWTAPLPAQSSPASQKSGDGGLPGKKIALDLQLADLAVQIVNDLLRTPDRRRPVAARKQLARTLHQLLLPVADYRRMNPKLRRQLSQGLLPRKRRHRHPRFELRAVLLPLYARLSRACL